MATSRRLDWEAPNPSDFTGKECTLNSKPAIIRMSPEGYAWITVTGSEWHNVEYSWYAVDYVMREKGGRFKA